MLTRTRRYAALSCTAALVLVVAGCTPGSEPEPSSTPTPSTPSVSTSPTPDDAQAEAAVSDVVARFVDAMVAMENSGEVDPAPMYGIASDDVAKAESARVKDLVDQGIHREGRPTLGEPTITVDGSTARYEVCMDQDKWVGVYEDQKLGTNYGPLPTGWELTLVGDAWTVTATVPDAEVSITC